LLRSAAGALARRGDHAAAAEASLALGTLLREAGRIEKAVAAFDAARHVAEAGGRALDAIRAVVEIGLARTDAGRLAEAEAALQSAMIAAMSLNSASMVERVANAQARCLLWQGRLDEAEVLLRTGETEDSRQWAIRTRLLARVALARRDLVAAGSQAALALRLADRLGDAREQSAAHEVLAVIRSHAGDLAGVREHVGRGLRAARAAHSPVRLWRLRVALLEGLIRLRDRDARRLASRLARTAPATLPALLRGRIDKALLDVLAEAPAARQWRARLGALTRVHGASALTRSKAEGARMEIIEELIEVVGLCQDGEDESTTLSRICRSVRERLDALSVSLQAGPPAHARLAADGRIRSGPSALVARIADTGLVIPPARSPEGGLESGAPVRYGGDVVAALVCRWGSDRAPDATRVGALLATAAAVCAPRVRLALDRLAAPATPPVADRCGLIGTSQRSDEIRSAIGRAALAPFPALIVGESGSGKELVARAIHRSGPRRDRPFCALNCAALNDELIEAELFGHARGAFSGALHDRVGFFEEADGGSLFLDEVSELSPRGQAKVLRAVQEGEIRRVGENFSRRVDVRLIAATNRDLRADVEAGRFRQDLLYRLDVIRIAVPPLRERIEDVAALAGHFWADVTRRTGSRATLTPEILATLSRYDWPGNVRELQNVMAALAVQAPARGRVEPRLLPRSMAQAAASGCRGTLEEARRSFERRYVQAALAREGWHRGRAAAALGLSRQGFAKTLVRLAIEPARLATE
jgi:DNA-binding NtrC family response regulator/tetratricopeptide (TPR) repeat protein